MTFAVVRPLCRVAPEFRVAAYTTATTIKGALEAIAQRNQELNAFVSHITSEEAKAHGDQYDEPLKDWPVAVKANIATTVQPTSCASNALRDYVSPYQATAVDALVRAGAIVVGKTNMDEFGMGAKNEYTIYGAACNPREQMPGIDGNTKREDQRYRHSPGGSSGGSAAAVASGMCRVALGSDTGGSVRLPAAWCGVVGFKPTYGRVSRHGLVAYGSSLDAIGVMARDVNDVRATFRAISVPDSRDMTCMSGKLRMQIDALTESRTWTKNLAQMHNCLQTQKQQRPLAGIRIGIPKEFWVEELSCSALDSWKAGAQRLADLGCEVIQVSLPHIPSSLPAYYTLAFAESSSNLARYDGIRYGMRSSQRPVAVNGSNASYKYANTRSEGLGSEVQRRILLGTYVMTASASEQYHILAQKVRRLIQKDFDLVYALPNALALHGSDMSDVFLRNRPTGVDALLFPTVTDTAPLLDTEDQNLVTGYVNDIMTVPANLAGIPAISVPIGTDSNGMPVGLQLTAQYGDDDLLLSIAGHL
ncbi:Trimeric GatFAB AmidoTransferase(AdT) complex subunit [Coemansia sp. RSA 1646]|nr:Trimeric GatFAB AmidoTransferase(AdT) complex subunit [Coemansia sp. RSA 1646]KAJ1771494.1 Trimeric GatFAB AmidoTransferase(AdT) complex subunit [Coemansia sp. RSA 1843]KAJ2093211.1 Trimeric GatFAB AmidoTransferase(AdT) complex subunit [Coemansia sp. RSA 986]KAJ2217524.1 Trimeric GatFAB AmidoTransferase(AdT) complex subunit [Coemansia sp. RSA 487]